MACQTESLRIFELFDQALRLESEVAGIFLREDGGRLTILAETGAQLTINHKTDHIVLKYHNSRLQRASFIMHEAEGERFSTSNHPV
jgi:hypothetical protein